MSSRAGTATAKGSKAAKRRERSPRDSRTCRPVTHSQERDQDRDAALVLRVGEGDEGAYQELLERHGGRLYNFALRLTRNTAEAEDIVQETFMRLWLHANDFDPSGRASTWLYRIAHNLGIDRLRARGRFADIDLEGEDAEPVPSSASQPLLLLDAKRRAEALHRALDSLPERQASAIVLVHLHGLSGTEAAEVLGVSTEALESLLSRGRRALKTRLGASELGALG
jgi:RNA polymerase sigma-70 factor, ECF subfamily